MYIRKDQCPLYAPSVDLHVIRGIQGYYRLQRIDDGVSVDLLLYTVIPNVLSNDRFHELAEFDPFWELAHVYDTIRSVIGLIFPDGRGSRCHIDLDESIDHLPDHLNSGRFPSPGLIITHYGMRHPDGISELMLAYAEFLSPFPDCLSGFG